MSVNWERLDAASLKAQSRQSPAAKDPKRKLYARGHANYRSPLPPRTVAPDVLSEVDRLDIVRAKARAAEVVAAILKPIVDDIEWNRDRVPSCK